MADLGILHGFLQRARRRAAAAVVAEQAVIATGAGLGGAILLLILGTQILDWYWPLLLFAASFGFGAWRTLRRIPSAYKLAQQVDRRLSLDDCLSTACYFSKPESNGRGEPQLREYVASQAVELCRTLDAGTAVPWRAPRSAYATLAVALIAFGMFGVRYGVKGSLDLRPPLVNALVDFFRPSREVAEARKKQARQAAKIPGQENLALDPEMQRPPDAPPPTDDVLAQGDPIKADRKEVPSRAEDEFSDLEGSDGERATPGDGKQGEQNDEASRDGENTGQNAKSQQKDQSGEDSSLLDKMRDAFQNMLAKLKMQPKATAGNEAKNGKQGGARKQEGGEKSQSQNKVPGQGAQRPDQQGDQMAAGGENSQVAQGRANERNPERNPADGEKSGIGKSDGAKDLREAEQLAAMGKITELFGKRQANLTGEVMVEVSSSKPQGLKTAYTERGAAHGEGGGEIHRDEVPILYQQYVQQYFEQVHKPAPAAEAAKP